MAFALGVASTTAALVACSGPPPGVISFTEGTASAEQSATEDDDDTDTREKPATGTTSSALNAVFAQKVYPDAKSECGSCHLAGTGGASVFFGADDKATYAIFKQRNFYQPTSAFVTKGQHTGPALSDKVKAAVTEWAASEGGGAPDGG